MQVIAGSVCDLCRRVICVRRRPLLAVCDILRLNLRDRERRPNIYNALAGAARIVHTECFGGWDDQSRADHDCGCSYLRIELYLAIILR